MELIDNLKKKYETGNIAIKLIFINAGVFVAVWLVSNIFNFSLSHLISMPTHLSEMIVKPWTLVTYSFFHTDLLHLLFNMVFLYFIGDFFLSQFNRKEFLKIYIGGGIAGGLAVILCLSIFTNTESSILLGASAAIYAIFFSMVAYQPEMRINLMFINTPIKLQDLGLVFVGISFLFILIGNNVGGNVSHLGGAAFGYLYMKQFEKGNDFLNSPFLKIKELLTFKKKKFTDINKPPKDDYEYKDFKAAKQKDIDAILDKISRSGYESLSAEEKGFLFKAGKN